MTLQGGPKRRPTAADRRAVAELPACGMSEKAISAAMGVSRPTLQAHYADELATGQAKKRAELICMTWRRARQGNTAAILWLERMTRR